MKQEFSTSWQGSTQPRKQRKFRFNAPLHLRAKFLSAHLSDALQEKMKCRTASVRKGDEVSLMRGAFKKKTGKITEVDTKKGRIYIEGIVVTKKDGSKVQVPVQPSNVQLISLVEDKMRFVKQDQTPKAKTAKTEKKAEKKAQAKPAKTENKTEQKEAVKKPVKEAKK
ncbi:MAG TPA: 50S ribosomal protein L24 [Candidatus Nanoarchaeia archaeon]|nr:50S ribosomal protein L24 [Candidatus Nanoarchaeia archaeon]